MFTTPFPVYPAKVRAYPDQVLKFINILVFIGTWACIVVTVNDVSGRVRNTIEDFWAPQNAYPELNARLRQRLDAIPCWYAAEIQIGDFDVQYNISSSNREFLFAECAGLIRQAVLVSCAAVFLSALNRVAFNYNWHALTCGGDSNFYAPKGYLLLLELAAIIWAIVALVHPQHLSEYLSDYITNCGGGDIPHLFEAPPFIAMFCAHSITLFAYVINWIAYWMDAVREIPVPVRNQWDKIEDVLCEECQRPAHEKAWADEPWTRDGVPGRPILDHVEYRLRDMLQGTIPAHGFPAIKGIRHQVWVAHGFQQHRKERLRDEDDVAMTQLSIAKPDAIVVRGCATQPDVNGVYNKVEGTMMWEWLPPSYTNARCRVFPVVADDGFNELVEGPQTWILGYCLEVEEGGEMRTQRMWRSCTLEESPLAVQQWKEELNIDDIDEADVFTGVVPGMQMLSTDVLTPYGPAAVQRPATIHADDKMSRALPDHWWVRLEGSPGGVGSGDVVLPWSGIGPQAPNTGKQELLSGPKIRPRPPPDNAARPPDAVGPVIDVAQRVGSPTVAHPVGSVSPGAGQFQRRAEYAPRSSAGYSVPHNSSSPIHPPAP